VVRFLSDKGHAVTGLDTDYYANGDFTSPPDGYPRLRKDLRDATAGGQEEQNKDKAKAREERGRQAWVNSGRNGLTMA
jgi:hypothetical protein